MSWINKACIWALALLMASFALSEADLLDATAVSGQPSANYKTFPVAKGVYESKVNTGLSAYYPIECAVIYEGAPARFVEFHVKRNDVVEKGQLLVTLNVERDEVAITSLTMQLDRLCKNYEVGILERQEEIEEKQRRIAETTNPYDREIGMLEMEKLHLAYQKYCFETENAISDKQNELDQLLETYKNVQLFAPTDGIVSQMTYLGDNAPVTNGMQLLGLYDPNEVLFSVSDADGKLRYNMPVTVSIGRNNNRITTTGRVVACPKAKPGTSGDTNAYVSVSFENGVPANFGTVFAQYDSAYLGNVYVVDRAAVSHYDGRYFVYKLSEDGMVSKRYVQFAFGNNTTGALLLGGVSEGEVLIID